MTPIPAAIDSAWLHCLNSRSQRRRRGAEPDEHGREAGDEQERGEENVAPRLRLAFIDQRLDARSGKVAKIGAANGSTQGETKEMRPAPNAAGKDTSAMAS